MKLHLGPGGRMLYEGKLWRLAYQLERELLAYARATNTQETEEALKQLHAPW